MSIWGYLPTVALQPGDFYLRNFQTKNYHILFRKGLLQYFCSSHLHYDHTALPCSGLSLFSPVHTYDRQQKTDHLARWEIRDEKAARITGRPGRRTTSPDSQSQDSTVLSSTLILFMLLQKLVCQHALPLVFSSQVSPLLDTFKTNTINLY